MALRLLSLRARATRTSARLTLQRSLAARFSSDVSADRLRVCIVGAGPAGFYSAKYLLKEHDQVYVDMLEALPTPYGLVRSGVAPDHPEVKSVMNDFENVAQDPRFNFLGNVRVGQDIQIDELKQHYHAILLSYGASGDRALGIPGEELRGVHSARAFVNWYNGHPAFRDLEPDLSVETAVIFGQGNVAIDCARVLTKSVEELKTTDISQHAIDALSKSNIKKVYVVGRRGSAQAAFTMKEVREITKLDGVGCVVDPLNLQDGLNAASTHEINEQRAKKRMHELLSKTAKDVAVTTTAPRQIQLQFLRSPVAFQSDPSRPDHVGSVHVEKMRLEGEANHQVAVGTGEIDEIPCGLALRSIGYKSEPIDAALPFNKSRHVVANESGRVVTLEGERVAGLYCAGWLKRGPSGIIGSNIVDAKETVACIVEDAAKSGVLTPSDSTEGLAAVRRIVLAHQPKKQLVTWQDVVRLHTEEEKRGAEASKPREKFTCVDEMLAMLK